MAIEYIKSGTKSLRLSKVVYDAQFEMRTVLTHAPFDYVDLWLRREHKDEALFYWRQAQDFHRAATGLPMESAPLVLYYCFMNAAKALLTSKQAAFSPYHGVTKHPLGGLNSKAVLSNEGIEIKVDGIVPALAAYFGESEPQTIHKLEDVLYNLAFIHRTYCLTYPKKPERFLPLKSARFIRDPGTNDVRLRAEVVDDINWKAVSKRLPAEVRRSQSGGSALESQGTTSWAAPGSVPSTEELDGLRHLNARLRQRFQYINGAHTLWYLKLTGSCQINRSPVTLTLAAMHRLSEMCRYKPSDLRSLLNGQKNWLLSEFVAMSPAQFIDEIACEMTGHQIMIPNVRVPF